MARYRLLARAQMRGEIREPGFIFELAEGEKGPMRSKFVHHDRFNVATGINGGANVEDSVEDEPLYELVPEEPELEPARVAETPADQGQIDTDQQTGEAGT